MHIAERLRRGRVVVLTGAGMSVESGIPDFRSSGGLWTTYPPEDYATLEAFLRNPRKVWRFYRDVERTLRQAHPNRGHDILARWCQRGWVDGVVTQNIDGLHERAGSRRVVAYHGTMRELHCPACGARYDASRVEPDPDGVPYCGCGRPLKPAIVLFGEAIPASAHEDALAMVRGASTLLVLGTSSMVMPAAELPLVGRRAGAHVVHVNTDATAAPLWAHERYVGAASAWLGAWDEALTEPSQELD